MEAWNSDWIAQKFESLCAAFEYVLREHAAKEHPVYPGEEPALFFAGKRQVSSNHARQEVLRSLAGHATRIWVQAIVNHGHKIDLAARVGNIMASTGLFGSHVRYRSPDLAAANRVLHRDARHRGGNPAHRARVGHERNCPWRTLPRTAGWISPHWSPRFPHCLPRFMGENFEKNQKLIGCRAGSGTYSLAAGIRRTRKSDSARCYRRDALRRKPDALAG